MPFNLFNLFPGDSPVAGGSAQLSGDTDEERKKKARQQLTDIKNFFKEAPQKVVRKAQDFGNLFRTEADSYPQTTAGLFGSVYKNEQGKYINSSTGKEEQPFEWKELFKPKSYAGGQAGRFVANTADDIFGGMLMGLPAGRSISSAAKLTPKLLAGAAGKGAAVLTAVGEGMKFLKTGQHLTGQEALTTAGTGMVFGLLEPQPLKGAKANELGVARKRWGFSPSDSPEQLKAKYYDWAKKFHNNGQFGPQMVDLNRDYELLTSAKPPVGASLAGLKTWLRDLWKKPAKAAKQETKALPPPPDLAKPPGSVVTELPFDPSRIEKQIMPPGVMGNPSNKWEVQIRYKGWAADKKGFATEAEAQKYLKDYNFTKFRGLSSSVAEDYYGTHFDPFAHGMVAKPPPAPPAPQLPGISDLPQAIREYRQDQGVNIMPSGEVQVSPQLEKLIELAKDPDVQKQTAQQVAQLPKNPDGTITVYRVGTPRPGDRRPVSASLSKESAQYFANEGGGFGVGRPITEYNIRPEDVRLVLGGDEQEVLIRNPALATPPSSKLTVEKIDKQEVVSKFNTYLDVAKDESDFAQRVDTLTSQLDNPENAQDSAKLKTLRAEANKKLLDIAGISESDFRAEYAQLMMMKDDVTVGPMVQALMRFKDKIDARIGKPRTEKVPEVVTSEIGPEGKYLIPYGRYSTRGTLNREWVQENIPLLYMGNKRGMMGYILDVLGIKEKDLGNISPADVSHLKEFKTVTDVFGGSGLMSNVSKKFFPDASVTYNELNSKTIRAIQYAQKHPTEVQRFVSEIGKYMADHPDADWLSHFHTVYPESTELKVAAQLLEAAGGRTGEITPNKISYILKAIPNFAKTFKNVAVTNRNAWDIVDEKIASGKPGDFLWLDPPYIWSTGYGTGADMERASGFMKLIDKLGELNKKGVKFVFFNNDPEVQVAKAGREAVYLDKIMSKINTLSNEGVAVIKGIKPIGTTDRREMMITNLSYGQESGRLLSLKEVQSAIEKLRNDPAAAPRELLKLYRDLRNSSEYAPTGQSLTASQIVRIKAMVKRLRIKSAEMKPVMDELLSETALSKMTREDGDRLISWLQPSNWDIIEDRVRQTREMMAAERRHAVVGERFVPHDEALEKQFGAIAHFNKTIAEVENVVRSIDHLPPVDSTSPSALGKIVGSLTGQFVSQDLAAKMLGIKASYHVPFRAIINIANNHFNRMSRDLSDIFASLSPEERKQAIFIQANAADKYKGTITAKARQTAAYLEELADANIEIINRLRVAKGQPPLEPRKPYIPYIISEDLAEAANLGDRVKFWEKRLSTAEDFAAGLFTWDPERIVKVWSETSASWLKKNLFSALLQPRYDALFASDNKPGALYAKMITDLDIHNLMPDGEKLFRTVGREINRQVGKIMPRRIPVDEELAKSILNTVWGQELKDQISKGYLTVPRFKVPNVTATFAQIFYPLHLAWNFGFALLNRTQPYSGLPFVGTKSFVAGRLKMYGMFLPWNARQRRRVISMLEESGYEYGRMIAGNETASLHSKFAKTIDHSINFLGDVTEFMNRSESALQALDFIADIEKKTRWELPAADKERVAAQFSAFINFLAGKGYSPVAQRSFMGRLAYIFTQFPINQINVYHEMLKYSFKDKHVRGFWKTMSEEGAGSEKAWQFFQDMPKQSRARFFLMIAALALPVATLYMLSRSWNVASRALPAIPRISLAPLASAFANYLNDPTDENKGLLLQEVRSAFRATALERVKDALAIYNFGMIQTTTTGRPVFVDQNVRNEAMALVFGRSALPEYERSYPGFLTKLMTGNWTTDEVAKLQGDRAKIRAQETQDAVELTKLISSSASTEEITKKLAELSKSGRLTPSMKSKMRQYLKEKYTGVSALDRSIANLSDADQAEFIYNKIMTLPKDKLGDFLQEMRQKGLITDNVRAEIKKLIQSQNTGK